MNEVHVHLSHFSKSQQTRFQHFKKGCVIIICSIIL